MAVRTVLCFVDAEWGLFARPFSLGDILVTGPRRLGGLLAANGSLARAELEDVARQLAAAFPAYAPSGTSHRPTGA